MRRTAPLLILLAGALLAGPGCSGLMARAERAVRQPVGAGGGGGCGEFTSEPRPVSVIVVGQDGEPLSDLKVTCAKSPVPAGRTDENGQVTLARSEECSDVCGCHTTCDEVEIQHPTKRALSHVAAIRGDAVRIVLSDVDGAR